MKLPQAARRCWGLGCVVSPPMGYGVRPREPSTFPTKNSSNANNIADPKCVTRFLGKKVEGTFPMLSPVL